MANVGSESSFCQSIRKVTSYERTYHIRSDLGDLHQNTMLPQLIRFAQFAPKSTLLNLYKKAMLQIFKLGFLRFAPKSRCFYFYHKATKESDIEKGECFTCLLGSHERTYALFTFRFASRSRLLLISGLFCCVLCIFSQEFVRSLSLSFSCVVL